MREAGVVIDIDGQPIFWHAPSERSGGSLPDSRSLWDVLWENRHRLTGFAHSHPGGGIPGPSQTDLTTFAAVESGLGQRLYWYIVSSDHVIVCYWNGPQPLDYMLTMLAAREWRQNEPHWVPELRRLSTEV